MAKKETLGAKKTLSTMPGKGLISDYVNKKYNAAKESEPWTVVGEDKGPAEKDLTGNKVKDYIYRVIAPTDYPSAQWQAALHNLITNNPRMKSVADEKKVFETNQALLEKERDLYERLSDKSLLVNAYFNEDLEGASEEDQKIVKEITNVNNRRKEEITDFFKMSEGMGMHDEDLWRKYLGLPQINNTVVESPYKPTRAKDENAKYYSLSGDPREAMWTNIVEDVNKKASKGGATFPMGSGGTSGLANVTVDMGEDEKGKYLSVYDIYDFGIPGEKLIGSPYEIYDRTYVRETDEGLKRIFVPEEQLKSIDVNDPGIDIVSLKRELSTRGYSIPEREKVDYDLTTGVYGTPVSAYSDEYDEPTRNALKSLQESLNKPKPNISQTLAVE